MGWVIRRVLGGCLHYIFPGGCLEYCPGRLSGILSWKVVCTSINSIALRIFWLYFHRIRYLFVSRHAQLSLLSYLDFRLAWHDCLWPERGFCVIMGSSSSGTFLLGFSLFVIFKLGFIEPHLDPLFQPLASPSHVPRFINLSMQQRHGGSKRGLKVVGEKEEIIQFQNETRTAPARLDDTTRPAHAQNYTTPCCENTCKKTNRTQPQKTIVTS